MPLRCRCDRDMPRCWRVRARARRSGRLALRATMCRCCNSIRWPCRMQRAWPARRIDWMADKLGATPIVIAASAPPDQVAELQRRLGRDAAGALIEQTLARYRRGSCRAGVRRLVVAGGETAGAVVSRLGVRSLRIGAEIDPGVPWTYAEGGAHAAAAVAEVGQLRRARLLPQGVRGVAI